MNFGFEIELFGVDKKKSKEPEVDIKALYAQIGEQKMSIDFLKKKLS